MTEGEGLEDLAAEYLAADNAYHVLMRVAPDYSGELHQVLQYFASHSLLAQYIRQIGRERATPVVLGEQLRILGLRGTGELAASEALALKTFAATLCDIDDYQAEEARRLAAENAEEREIYRVPIEETTLEPVDDRFSPTM